MAGLHVSMSLVHAGVHAEAVKAFASAAGQLEAFLQQLQTVQAPQPEPVRPIWPPVLCSPGANRVHCVALAAAHDYVHRTAACATHPPVMCFPLVVRNATAASVFEPCLQAESSPTPFPIQFLPKELASMEAELQEKVRLY